MGQAPGESARQGGESWQQGRQQAIVPPWLSCEVVVRSPLPPDPVPLPGTPGKCWNILVNCWNSNSQLSLGSLYGNLTVSGILIAIEKGGGELKGLIGF